jgi:hypothetical protein
MPSIAEVPPAPTQAAGFVGIARLAAESPRVRERAEVEYFALQSRSALNRESSGRMPFAWSRAQDSSRSAMCIGTMRSAFCPWCGVFSR